ncbi:MAG: carboxypeptidase regulatory-like domain-containing protein, partial [Acidobacteria bacterium]|nr:carboxypeptidase regulatory-like domain-containing protein [Acidobacteriota bacterium]
LAADVDGYVPPAAWTSELFFEFNSTFYGGTDSIVTHELVPDFITPANSTFTLKPAVPVAAFDPRDPNVAGATRGDIEQPVVASTAYLDSIGSRAMFRVGYRNLGTSASPVNSYVTSWTVNVSGTTPSTPATYQAAVRWEEMRRDGAGTLSIFDQGTHAPDPVSGTGRNRWLSSIAQDNQGNIGVGFSLSGNGAADFPSIVWAGRTGGQTPAGTLNQGEATMFASTGYQNTTNERWGDYSSMTVDPTDDCTFWFTSEWRDSANNSSSGNFPFYWSTRIGNFKYAGCTAPPKGQIAANVTNCSTGQPVLAADVLAQAGGFLRRTNAGGTLVSNIIAAPGNYTVTGFRKGYTTSTSAGVVVTDGLTSTANICLGGGFPIIELNTTPALVLTDENGNGRLDPGETAKVNLPLRNVGGLDASAVSGTLSTTTPGVTIISSTRGYPNLAKEVGVGSNAGPFQFRVGQGFICGAPIDFTFTTDYNGTSAAKTFTFTIQTSPPVNVSTTLDTTAPANGLNYTAATGTQTGREVRTGVGSTCAGNKAAPGLNDSTPNRRYDSYTFTALSTGCYTVTVTQSSTLLYSVAYNNSGYLPATPNTNFLADPGSSTTTMTYSFNVTAGQNFTVVVHEVTVGAGIGQNYTLSLSGPPLAGGCTTYAGPSAAAVTISGRVITANGAAIRGATVSLTDTQGAQRSAITNAFGYYSFDNVQSGQTYLMRALARRYIFTPRSVNVTDSLTNVDFIDGQ